jgi:hypothetical protein
MQGMAFGHHLETLHDGLTTFRHGEPVQVPLVATKIDISVESGLALVRTARTFRNAEDAPIEAVMTFPVGFDAVVTGLVATIDGRRLVGTAQEKADARETYEEAIDEGRLSILHEEVLRGIHILSVGALPPQAEVIVELEQAIPLVDAGGTPFLRLPMTVGQIYGTSPLLPTDDLVTAGGVRHHASLTVSVDKGRAVMGGHTLVPDEPRAILLDHAVELQIEGGAFGCRKGRAADGRVVEVCFEPAAAARAPLDLHVMVDRSGSTMSPVRDGGLSVWEAMRDGLASELAVLRPTDRITLWQFDDLCNCLGSARGEACAKLPAKLEGPDGGTELGNALRAALKNGAKDILVMTDGQTWAHMVEEFKGEDLRISAILVGPASLDANIGHLCALTGGQVLYAPGRDVASALRSAFAALRKPTAAVEGKISAKGPDHLTAMRGGVNIRATWSESNDKTQEQTGDAVGGFAAALSLPLLSTDQAEDWARAHSLCTHSTSLVLVDEVGVATQGFSRMRKVPVMQASMAFSVASPSSGSPRSFGQAMPNFSASSAPRRVAFGLPPRPTSLDMEPEATQPNLVSQPHRPKPEIKTPSVKDRLIQRILSRNKRKDIDPAASLFTGFAWDIHGDALLNGDVSSLSIEQIEAVMALAALLMTEARSQVHPIENISEASNLALGLIARRMEDRLADRFARRALKDAPPWVEARE